MSVSWYFVLRWFLAKALADDSTISTSSAGPPPLSLRELVRRSSDPAEPSAELRDSERKNCWREAQNARKRFVKLGQWDGRASTGLATLLSKSHMKDFEGVLNDKHRLFVFSADMWAEQTEAWSKPPVLEEQKVEPVFDFLKQQAKETDIVLVCDGCCRQNRAVTEKFLGERVPGGGGLYDFVVMYDRSKADKLSRSRKVFCASSSETCYLRLAVARTKLQVKDRGDEYQLGSGGTTADLSMVGVPLALPSARILLSEKSKVFGSPMDAPTSWKSSAVPLFWRENKGPQYWQTVMSTLDIGGVVDITPGSGCLASCCLSLQFPSFTQWNCFLVLFGMMLDLAWSDCFCNWGSHTSGSPDQMFINPGCATFLTRQPYVCWRKRILCCIRTIWPSSLRNTSQRRFRSSLLLMWKTEMKMKIDGQTGFRIFCNIDLPDDLPVFDESLPRLRLKKSMFLTLSAFVGKIFRKSRRPADWCFTSLHASIQSFPS